MKNYLSIFSLVFFISSPQAQPISTRDAQALLNVPVLTGESSSGILQPNLGRVCFDKKMMVNANAEDGRQLDVCLFINTSIGFIGFFTGRPGTAGSCLIKPDNDKFRFTIISLRGNTYQYLTDLKNGRLEKKVITHISDFYYYPWTGLNPESSVLDRLNETGSYGHRRSRIQTQAYQAHGSAAKFHLYGNNLPAHLRVTSASRYLGVFGVGYASFEGKVYLMMAMLQNSMTVSSVLSVENTETCFNTAGFTLLEDEYYYKAKAKIRADREKLMNDNIRSGPCSSHDLTIKNFKIQMLDKEEAWLEKTRQGNLLIDAPTRQALANIHNYEDLLQLGIYDQEKKICKLENSLSGRTISDADRRKLDCYRRQLNQMKQNQVEMAGIERRFPGNLGMQVLEKQKLMMRMELCD
jgi:hypothetical protein